MRYGLAISLLLAAKSSEAFQSSLDNSLRPTARRRIFRHGISASVQEGPASEDPLNTTSIYLSNMVSEGLQTNDDEEEIQIAARRQKYSQRAGSFKVTLPLVQSRSSDNTVRSPSLLGMKLGQFFAGQEISDNVLNLDSLVIESISEEAADVTVDNVQVMDSSKMKRRLNPELGGVYVSSVEVDSPAWNAGVRPGDILASSAATFGESLWPKTTLEGVRSSLTSRRMVSGTATFEFERSDTRTDNIYELTLGKPIGLQLKETEDGYVEVAGFTLNAPNLVKMAVKIGDRVIAVESSLGGQMWPVSTVDGVISAYTSRLPGQQVTLRFERPASILKASLSEEGVMEKPTFNPAADTQMQQDEQQQQRRQLIQQEAGISEEDKQLLKRCRDILKRYPAEESAKGRTTKFMDKFAVPAMVADRVMEALAKANASMDSLTLSMVMDAYMSCAQPGGAIRAFESAVGLNGNGSILPPSSLSSSSGGGEDRITPNPAALNVFTISSLLQAHAMKRDLRSVKRVVAAMEGRAGEKVSGLETAAWPGTGNGGSVAPDTQCYNIAMSAASKAGTPDGLLFALKLFKSLGDPTVIFKDDGTGRPEKNTISYNSIISALALAGKHDDAFNLFFNMKRVGLKPDKYTYTSLIKSCVNDGDLQELLYDMKEHGVKDDVVMYNSMIKSLCEDGKLSEARTLITRMEARNVAPDSMTYGLLMKGLLKQSKPGACLALFESACANAQTSKLTENVYLYTIAITATSVLGDHERALDLVSRMSAIGVKPNTKTLTALMGACLASGRPDLAAQVYKRIDRPDGYAMSQGLEALCGSGDLDAAAKILSTQKRGSRDLSGKELMQAYSTIVAAAVRYNDFDMARSMYKELLAKSFIPSKKMFRSITEAVGLSLKGQIVLEAADPSEEQFRFLLFLMDGMRERSLPIDAHLYSATIACGNQLGGVHREVSLLLMKSKIAQDESTAKVLPLEEPAVESQPSDEPQHFRCEELLEETGLLDKLKSSQGLISTLDVPVGKRDARAVFFAERSIVSRMRQKEAKQENNIA